MVRDGIPEFIYGGTSKAASTWIYECLEEHPEITMHHRTDSLHFFDINYHNGLDWYRNQFDRDEDEHTIGETTTSYLGEEKAPRRIAQTIPEVTLIFCLRNPVDRAFSQWWHGKSDGYWDYDFADILEFYPPYQMWAQPGFYASHLNRYDQFFDEQQLNIFWFDDLVEDNESFIKEIYDCIDVDDSYIPNRIGEKSNPAHWTANPVFETAVNVTRNHAPDAVKSGIKPIYHKTRNLFESRSEYEAGMDAEVRNQLENIFATDVKELQLRTGRNLNDWFDYVDLNEVDPDSEQIED